MVIQNYMVWEYKWLHCLMSPRILESGHISKSSGSSECISETWINSEQNTKSIISASSFIYYNNTAHEHLVRLMRTYVSFGEVSKYFRVTCVFLLCLHRIPLLCACPIVSQGNRFKFSAESSPIWCTHCIHDLAKSCWTEHYIQRGSNRSQK